MEIDGRHDSEASEFNMDTFFLFLSLNYDGENRLRLRYIMLWYFKEYHNDSLLFFASTCLPFLPACQFTQ